MTHKVSVSVDVGNMAQALAFYTQALGCTFKEHYTDQWQVVTITELDIHMQEKAAGSIGAGEQVRAYHRHWTPVHLDFSVEDIRIVSAAIEAAGGCVENQIFSDQADIAHCVDPFGNGFCIIRE